MPQNNLMTTLFYSSCPVVKRSSETFVQYVNIGGQRTRHEFIKPIVWLQESEATIQYLHGGQKINVASSTYNDYYGYLTSVEGVQTDFSKIATLFAITTESSLELVIKATVFLRPAIETPEEHDFIFSSFVKIGLTQTKLPMRWYLPLKYEPCRVILFLPNTHRSANG